MKIKTLEKRIRYVECEYEIDEKDLDDKTKKLIKHVKNDKYVSKDDKQELSHFLDTYGKCIKTDELEEEYYELEDVI